MECAPTFYVQILVKDDNTGPFLIDELPIEVLKPEWLRYLFPNKYQPALPAWVVDHFKGKQLKLLSLLWKNDPVPLDVINTALGYGDGAADSEALKGIRKTINAKLRLREIRKVSACQFWIKVFKQGNGLVAAMKKRAPLDI